MLEQSGFVSIKDVGRLCVEAHPQPALGWIAIKCCEPNQRREIVTYRIPLVMLLALVFLVEPAAATQPETCEANLEFEGDLSDSVYSVAPHSPVWTYQGYIYGSRVNRKQEIVITQKTPDGNVSEKVVFQGVQHNNHNAPSLAVDKAGHIHITGDLHNGGFQEGRRGQWNYWVSDKPHDIRSFTFRGGSVWNAPKTWLPSNMSSYVLFRPDNHDDLYVTWRGRILSRTDVSSYRAVNLATLPKGRPGPWEHLGVAHPERKHWPGKGIAWEDYARPMKRGGQGKSVYQTLRGHTWFDRKNHLHLAWIVFGPGAQTPGNPELKSKIGAGATHLLYAKSPDGGKTWRSVRNTRLSLPIQIDGDPRAVVLKRNPGDLTTQVYLTTTRDNRPIISYTVGGFAQHGEHYMVIADKRGRWSEPMRLPTGRMDNYRLFADRQGVLTLPASDAWYRSYDDGETWVRYQGLPAFTGGGSAGIDYRHLRDTGEIRFHLGTGEKGNRTVQVWTARFQSK